MKKILLAIISSMSLNQLYAVTSLKLNEVVYKQKYKLIEEYLKNNPHVLTHTTPLRELKDENDTPSPREINDAANIILKMSLRQKELKSRGLKIGEGKGGKKGGEGEKSGGNESRG